MRLVDRLPSTKLKRLFSIWLLISFIGTNHFSFPSYAAAPAESPAAKAFPPDLSAIQVPEGIGKIQEFYKGKGEKVVVLVQDAHAIPDAQRSIQKIIAHFQKQYGLPVIALEGASSELDPQIFKSFPDKELLKNTFEDYFEQGELTGSVAAAIFNETPGLYHGIEDWSLYEDGLSLYLKAAEKECRREMK